jgi:hypothetical protein
MKRTLVVLGLFLSGCNQFVGPTVECGGPREVINITQTATAARGTGGVCAFADPYIFTVAYSPVVSADAGSPQLLIGQPVTVIQSSAATLLCPAVGQSCTPDQGASPTITSTISSTGVLAYQGLFSLEPLGVFLQAGDTFEWEGVIATENFGPSNTCPLTAKISLTCQKAQ